MLDEIDFSDVRGWVAADGTLRLQMPDGAIVRVRGRVAGRDGEPGRDGDPGPPGPPPAAETIARAMVAYFIRHPVPKPKDGEPGPKGDPGAPGPKPTLKDCYEAVQAFLRDHPVPPPKDGEPGPQGLKGETGDEGPPGELGPIPRHELDDADKPTKIRFELERNEGGKTTKWGKWIDFTRLLPNMLPRQRQTGGGHVTLTRQQIIALIEETMTTSPLAGYRLSDEDSSGTVKYYGYTKDDSLKWYILKVDHSVAPITSRYTRGDSGYAAAFTARAGQTYSLLSDLSDL